MTTQLNRLSLAEYLDLNARNARHEEWSKQYRQSNGWTVIPAGVEPPQGAQISNEERSDLEVFEFCVAPPEKYFLYIKDNRADYRDKFGNVPPIGPYPGVATTWTGDYLGTVFFGTKWRDNFGGERIPVTVHARNGRTYYGTYFKSSGDYARVRLSKH